MSLQVELVAIAVPAFTFGAGGVGLLGTRARVAGVCAVAASMLALAGLATWWSGRDSPGVLLLGAALMLPAAWALFAYPRLQTSHAVDFCALVLVLGAGALGTAFVHRPTVLGTMAAALMLALLGQVWWRFERADEDDRLAILWTTLALVTAGTVLGLCTFVTPPTAAAIVAAALFATVGPAMVIGVRRPRVVDVRALMVQSVVFGLVLIVYLSLFLGTVAVFDMFGRPTPDLGVLAVIGAIAAMTMHPLRVVLRGVIDEILFGDRPDPLAAAARVVDRIGDDPVLALRAIREALVLPYASVSAAGVELAASGTPVTYVRRLPLRLGDDAVGEIVVGLRPGDLDLTADDVRTLRIVAPLLAQTLRARALAADLQQSRGQAIAAIEEERRRLRRDLHDGLGPTLSGIAFTADAARNTLRSDPDGADALLRGLRSEAVTGVGEIRRLVYAMRPPALDELGLVPALRQRATSMCAADGRAMQVTVEAGPLPTLPAAVETAAYRIATEALTNAARHSGTDTVRLEIAARDGRLSLTVRDGGRNRAPWSPGVGLASMRERAAEVGGTLSLDAAPTGAVVSALLPIG